MKVDCSKGVVELTQASTQTTRNCVDAPADAAMWGTTSCVSGGNLSTSSPLSVSEIESGFEDDASIATPEFSDDDASDLDDIVTTGTDVCHAATLEVLLENLEFVPAEVNRILKLIGTLDEKCEEITELLDRPCDDWFVVHRTKKQRKSAGGDETQSGDVTGGGGTKECSQIYRKIYEGQEAIPYEAYKVRLAKARKLERQKDVEMRSQELISIPDNQFKIIYEKDDETPEGGNEPQAKSQEAMQTPTTTGINRPVAFESQDEQKQPKKHAEKEKPNVDLLDSYFRQIEQEATSYQGVDAMEIDQEDFRFDESTMGEEWKDKLEEILQENQVNHVQLNDMETLQTFMENQLSLLWRYTLRKKALTRKVYEMVLHHYASLIQELQPNDFVASLRCYPESTVIQSALLNELEEQYVSVEEMSDLFKDVESLLASDPDGYATDRPDPATFIKQEESSTAPFFAEGGRKLLMDESYRTPSRQMANGAVSAYSPSNGSPQRYSEQTPALGEINSRHVQCKRHKSTKAPAGMSHAAKSPQSTGRLLTYHDIATPGAAEKLRGHPAELFWPDDDLWYLIHIDVIDPETKTANIVYITGDTERLELDDIVREGHMSLLPEAEDTDLSAEEDAPQQTADVEMGEEVVSEFSGSDMHGMLLDDASQDDDEMCTDDDEEEVIVNIHRNRQSRRAELKAESVQHRSS